MIVSLVSSKGGVSKSTLAISLAFALGETGDGVLLVDTDGTHRSCIRAAERAQWPELEHAPKVMTLDHNLHQPHQLPALAKRYRHVVIDTPGHMSKEQRTALLVSDVALVPISPSETDTETLDDMIPVVVSAQAGRPKLRAALVLTRQIARSSIAKQTREALSDTGLPLLQAGTHNRTAWAEAQTVGVGVTRYAPESTAALELRDLLEEVRSLNGRRK